jgi:hypothetical protein
MPAGLGDGIYAGLRDKANIAPTERTISAFSGTI